MKSILRKIASRLARHVRPLTGFHELVDRLGDLQRRIDKLEATSTDQFEALNARMSDRLTVLHQSYEKLALVADNLGSKIIPGEVDRLDGYIVHHAERQLEAFSGLTQGLRAKQKRVYAARGLDVLLIEGTLDILCPSTESGLLAYLSRHGVSGVEPGVASVLRSRLKPGSIAADIGANIGLHSLAMAACVGPTGRVTCFEPLPHLAEALQSTLFLNGFHQHTDVEQLAVADTPGLATFYRAAHSPLSSLFPLPASTQATSIDVQKTTLDAYYQPGSRLDLIKVDVEGAEPLVWRGMQRVLSDNPQLEIVLEWSGAQFQRSHEEPEAFMKELLAAGFIAYLISESGGALLTPFESTQQAQPANILLLPPHHR